MSAAETSAPDNSGSRYSEGGGIREDLWDCSITLNGTGGPGKLSAFPDIYGDTNHEMVIQVPDPDWLLGNSGILKLISRFEVLPY